MDIGALAKGIVVGFSIAAPVGPVGILCIRRTLAEGRMQGLVSGLGAASADVVYGCIAAFGLTLVSGLLSQGLWFRLIGGLFLCYLGIKTLLARPGHPVDQPDQVAEAPTVAGRGLLSAYSSTFLLTLTNPMTILSFAAIFGGWGTVDAPERYASAGMLILGVFLGSSLWWLALSSLVGLFRRKVTLRGLAWVNRISGAIIVLFGLATLATAVL